MCERIPPPTQTKQEAIISFRGANCLHDKRLNLLIAPKSFVAAEDITLSDGFIVKHGTRFFDWYTPNKFSSEGKFGNGWRHPTAEEAKYLDVLTGLLLKSTLGGYVGPNDMIVCRHAPEMAVKKLLNFNSVFFWTSTQHDKMYAYYAEISSKKQYRADASMYKSFGLSILCVKNA